MKTVFLSLLFAVVLFSSCSVLDRKPSIYYNENELSMRDIAEMRNSFNQNEDSQKNIELVQYGDVSSGNIVYWVSGGSVWHKTYSCGYIREGSKVFYGTEESAAENGKTDICSACKK